MTEDQTSAAGADSLRFGYASVTLGSHWPALQDRLRTELAEALAPQSLYGVFTPLFGLSSNQIIVMTDVGSGGDRDPSEQLSESLRALSWVEAAEVKLIAATNRPKTAAPPTREGIYVHRFFELPTADVDEAVELSTQAWDSFEQTFEVEVIGYFRTLMPQAGSVSQSAAQSADASELMLLNWYPSLAEWEVSRNFDSDPASRDRFAKRATLAHRVHAICTRLLV